MAAAVHHRRNFDPSEKDLVNYLWLKLRGETIPIPSDDLVPEIDIYGHLKPWEIFDRSESNRFHAFSRLKSRGGKRFHRSAGGGTWELKSTASFNEDDRFLKRNFIYEYGGKVIGQWSMVEFSLNGAVDNDFVVCKVRFNNGEKQSRTCRRGGRIGNTAGLSPTVGFRIREMTSVVKKELEEGGLDSEVAGVETREVKIRTEEEKLEEFDLQSKEEILALAENFWSEPPGNIWKTMSWKGSVGFNKMVVSNC
ncbi:hypothetical protein LINGRAHAP2_LOCUS28896 [Linum grandiflorum]